MSWEIAGWDTALWDVTYWDSSIIMRKSLAKHLFIGRGTAQIGQQSGRVGVHRLDFEDLKQVFSNVNEPNHLIVDGSPVTVGSGPECRVDVFTNFFEDLKKRFENV